MNWKRPRRLTYLLREDSLEGREVRGSQVSSREEREYGVWSCAPAPCGYAVPVPVWCSALLCAVLFSVQAVLCCSPLRSERSHRPGWLTDWAACWLPERWPSAEVGWTKLTLRAACCPCRLAARAAFSGILNACAVSSGAISLGQLPQDNHSLPRIAIPA